MQERFFNREDAATQLAEALKDYKNDLGAVVVAIPRGGVAIGYYIAFDLQLPLEVVLIKKLGHPVNPEYAIGAVSLNSRILSDLSGVSEDYIECETDRLRELLKNRYNEYFSNREPMRFKDKTVIIVDDGIATGNTILAATELIRQEQPKKIVIASPVAPGDFKGRALRNADEFVCLIEDYTLFAIGPYYEDFEQVSDAEVEDMIRKFDQLKTTNDS